MEKINLKIAGMHCEGCSNRLQKVLNNIEGVEDATVSFDTKIAQIEYNKEKVTLDEIKEGIQDAGFSVEE